MIYYDDRTFSLDKTFEFCIVSFIHEQNLFHITKTGIVFGA